MKWEGETCKVCGRVQRLVWLVKDDIWKDIVPLKYSELVLCLECFLAFADDKEYVLLPEDIQIPGWILKNSVAKYQGG